MHTKAHPAQSDLSTIDSHGNSDPALPASENPKLDPKFVLLPTLSTPSKSPAVLREPEQWEVWEEEEDDEKEEQDEACACLQLESMEFLAKPQSLFWAAVAAASCAQKNVLQEPKTRDSFEAKDQQSTQR